MTKVTLRHAALALAAAGTLSLTAAYAQTDSPTADRLRPQPSKVR